MAFANPNHERYNVKTLSKVFALYQSVPIPHGGRSLKYSADVSMYGEDAILSRMVRAFLREGKIPEKPMLIRGSIDKSLSDFVPTSDVDVEMIAEFRAFRERILELAHVFSVVSNTPLEWMQERMEEFDDYNP